jgi:hypothetical protein
MNAIRFFSSLIFCLLLPGLAQADFPDWNSVADVNVIELSTRDEDGSERRTKVWFVLLGGDAYLRTNNSRWLENLRRDPNLILHVEGRAYEARTEEIPGEIIMEKVDIASRKKYGIQERLIHLFRLQKPEILKISARPGDA